jgi:hypothetical protein
VRDESLVGARFPRPLSEFWMRDDRISEEEGGAIGLRVVDERRSDLGWVWAREARPYRLGRR